VLSTPRQPQPQYHSIESVRRIFWGMPCNDLNRSWDCRVKNTDSQLLKVTIFLSGKRMDPYRVWPER
jgi:hypothetical protein